MSLASLNSPVVKCVQHCNYTNCYNLNVYMLVFSYADVYNTFSLIKFKFIRIKYSAERNYLTFQPIQSINKWLIQILFTDVSEVLLPNHQGYD